LELNTFSSELIYYFKICFKVVILPSAFFQHSAKFFLPSAFCLAIGKQIFCRVLNFKHSEKIYFAECKKIHLAKALFADFAEYFLAKRLFATFPVV